MGYGQMENGGSCLSCVIMKYKRCQKTEMTSFGEIFLCMLFNNQSVIPKPKCALIQKKRDT